MVYSHLCRLTTRICRAGQCGGACRRSRRLGAEGRALRPSPDRTGLPSPESPLPRSRACLARTGAARRDLPPEPTDWRRLERWQLGLDALRATAPGAGDTHARRAVVPAPAHAAGALRNRGEQVLGRSRGEFATRVTCPATAAAGRSGSRRRMPRPAQSRTADRAWPHMCAIDLPWFRRAGILPRTLVRPLDLAGGPSAMSTSPHLG